MRIRFGVDPGPVLSGAGDRRLVKVLRKVFSPAELVQLAEAVPGGQGGPVGVLAAAISTAVQEAPPPRPVAFSLHASPDGPPLDVVVVGADGVQRRATLVPADVEDWWVADLNFVPPVFARPIHVPVLGLQKPG